eukprot:COSAG01_NODE_505_length_16132_cov_49.751528_9_plen_281_part_00
MSIGAVSTAVTLDLSARLTAPPRGYNSCTGGVPLREVTALRAREKQQVRRRIIDRSLHYEQVDVQQLPPLPTLHEISVEAAFQHLTATESRCLVVEVRRPCPPAGAPVSTPVTAAEMLGLLKQQMAAEETLHSASFDVCELERHMGTEECTEWMLQQCTAAHCDNGIVAEYCDVLSAMVECNTAVYHLTLERLVLVIGTYPFPLRHSLASLYVLLSRVHSSDQLRILEGQPGSIEGLAGNNMQQRDELVVFEQCYDRRQMYSSTLALRAYDALVARRASM